MAIQGTLTVDTEQLRTQAAAVRRGLTDMEGRFSDLKSLLNGTSSFWIGDAGDAHRKLYAARLAKIDEMFSRYREQVTDLETMAGIYQEAETRAQNLADTLQMSTL